MGALSLEKVDHLLWLGRYMERSYTTLLFILDAYDEALDDAKGPWREQLEELGFDAHRDNAYEFFNDCLFDMENFSSLAFSMDAAYGNAVRLRDVLGTESIAYVQMAVNSVEAAKASDAPLLDLQSVIDDIMAFKGCMDDYVVDDAARNIIKCGMSVERMDLYTRLSYHLGELPREAHRLASRIDRIGVSYDKKSFKRVIDTVFAPDFPDAMTYERLGTLLEDIAGIFSQQ